MQYTKAFAVGVLTLALGAAASTSASAEVQLTIQNGRISLTAKDATLRQILAEWAKVGQIKIVNGERVPGAPLTVQFNNLPEQQVLDTLLRGLSGYVAQPRETFQGNLSRYDRILVMPTLAATATATVNAAPPPMFPQPNNFPGVQQGLPAADDQDDDRAVPNRAPVFNSFPQPQPFPILPNGQNPTTVNPNVVPLVLPPPNQAMPMPGAAYPGGVAYPSGVSVPGMIVPAPPQPGQVGQPVQPKRPGGNL
jgi:hypothetical protein